MVMRNALGPVDASAQQPTGFQTVQYPAYGSWQFTTKSNPSGDYSVLASPPNSSSYEIYGNAPNISDALNQIDRMKKIYGAQ